MQLHSWYQPALLLSRRIQAKNSWLMTCYAPWHYEENPWNLPVVKLLSSRLCGYWRPYGTSGPVAIHKYSQGWLVVVSDGLHWLMILIDDEILVNDDGTWCLLMVNNHEWSIMVEQCFMNINDGWQDNDLKNIFVHNGWPSWTINAQWRIVTALVPGLNSSSQLADKQRQWLFGQ